MWRLVFSGKASLHEIEKYFTLDDIIEMNTILSMQDAEQEQRQRESEIQQRMS